MWALQKNSFKVVVIVMNHSCLVYCVFQTVHIVYKYTIISWVVTSNKTTFVGFRLRWKCIRINRSLQSNIDKLSHYVNRKYWRSEIINYTIFRFDIVRLWTQPTYMSLTSKNISYSCHYSSIRHTESARRAPGLE